MKKIIKSVIYVWAIAMILTYHKMVSVYSLSLIKNNPQFDDKIKTHLKLKNYII